MFGFCLRFWRCVKQKGSKTSIKRVLEFMQILHKVRGVHYDIPPRGSLVIGQNRGRLKTQTEGKSLQSKDFGVLDLVSRG